MEAQAQQDTRGYRYLYSTRATGIVNVPHVLASYLCDKCGAVVIDCNAHTLWHAKVEAK